VGLGLYKVSSPVEFAAASSWILQNRGAHVFYVLETIVDEHKITTAMIFNTDETSHTVVQRFEKITAQIGKEVNIKLEP
jgi:hypothetical protein